MQWATKRAAEVPQRVARGWLALLVIAAAIAVVVSITV